MRSSPASFSLCDHDRRPRSIDDQATIDRRTDPCDRSRRRSFDDRSRSIMIVQPCSCHTRQGLRVSTTSSSPATLDALIPPGSYSGKRDTHPIAHKLPTRAGLNQNDMFYSRNPKGLNQEGEREGGSLDLPSFSSRDLLLQFAFHFFWS